MYFNKKVSYRKEIARQHSCHKSFWQLLMRSSPNTGSRSDWWH